MAVRIATDDDVRRLVPMRDAVAVMEKALKTVANGLLDVPPIHKFPLGGGELVFTIGGERVGTAGFRVYETVGRGAGHEQITAAYDTASGRLKGVVVGELLGAWRTGALGGVAVKMLSAPDASRMGVIGTGLQAGTQLEAVAAVRTLEKVRVFSREPENRRRFAREMSERTGLEIEPVQNADLAANGADILVLATDSGEPVIGDAAFTDGMHVTTVGPKAKGFHELPIGMAKAAGVLATDAPQRILTDETHFLRGFVSDHKIEKLSGFVTGKRVFERSERERTLYLSSGLAGTEPLLADLVVSRLAAEASVDL